MVESSARIEVPQESTGSKSNKRDSGNVAKKQRFVLIVTLRDVV